MNSSPVPSPYPSPGEIIDGKYQIERTLGEGGMGCVARAYHMLLRAPVALKFMNPQFMTFPGAVERFINEGIASKKIRSDHVVPVDDVGKLPSGAPYLVMPCLEGLDLSDLLARDGTPGLPVGRAVHFTLQILRGLQAAHANGIIHRDMKPSNCFVVKHDGEADFVRILDFGISKVVQPGGASLTRTNSALGTPLYMSPEQARSPRDVDTRSDLYSVGVILYELLTGETPFFSEDGEFTEILYKLFTTEPPPVQSKNPDIPDGLAHIVHHALGRSPADRYATALDFAEALAPFADERSTRLLARMRTFKPEQILSLPPPANMPLPNSLVAFSKLEARPATDVMTNRPGVAVEPKAHTELLDSPSLIPPTERAQGTELLERKAPRGRTMPLAKDVDDATAKTQFGETLPVGSSAPPPRERGQSEPGRARPGAQTDLGAVRDAPLKLAESAAHEGKGGAKRFAAIGGSVVALALVVGAVVMNRSGAHDTSSATAESAQPPQAPSAPPPQSTHALGNAGGAANAAEPKAANAGALAAAAKPTEDPAQTADAGPTRATSPNTPRGHKPTTGPKAPTTHPGPGGDALDLGIKH